MESAGGPPVRLVVQYLGKSQPQCYRVIVYPDPTGHRKPLVFASSAELANRLSAILPGFDKRALEPSSDSFPQIVLAETLELSGAQLAELWRS
ncbi:MAG TPA: hypothetical protein VJQ82_15325 [Terriglobales bacterium]|nr:hypothetical protein [Terriglobales bacterium]